MAIYTLRSGVTNHPEDSILQELTDHVRAGGLLNQSTDLLVVQPAGGGLNVDVGTGRAYVKGSSTNAYPVRIDATATVAITSNASGNPRYTSIVLYIDKAATPGSTNGGNDVAKLMAVNGTPAASPVVPDDSAIQAAVGAANPFLRLADVLVASGASGISTGNITNAARRVFMKSPRPRNVIAYSATITPNCNTSDTHVCTLTGNVTVAAPTNMEVGDALVLEFIQDGTGGRSIAWFSTITWLSPDTTANTSANKRTTYAIIKTGSATYNGYLVGKEYA